MKMKIEVELIDNYIINWYCDIDDLKRYLESIRLLFPKATIIVKEVTDEF